MKIGILTFHRAENFGAILQAFALFTFLKNRGFQVEIIDYRCREIDVHYQILNPEILWSRKNFIASFREYYSRFKSLGLRRIRKAKFRQFMTENLVLSREYSTISKPLDYDAIIVGSDQVWNSHLCRGSESIYFLDFPFATGTKRISYAASSEKNGLDRLDDSIIENALNKFDRISVREEFLKAKLQPLVRKTISVCLDPTFLLEKKDYERLIKGRTDFEYILVYQMTPFPEYMNAIESIAREKGLKIMQIFGGYQDSKDSEIFKTVRDWGPIDILSIIAGAKYVFTTSFHGLALSIILEKDFWCIDKGDNYRQKSILTRLNLENRLLDSVTDISCDSIDYSAVNKKLKYLIKDSIDFLNI